MALVAFGCLPKVVFIAEGSLLAGAIAAVRCLGFGLSRMRGLGSCHSWASAYLRNWGQQRRMRNIRGRAESRVVIQFEPLELEQRILPVNFPALLVPLLSASENQPIESLAGAVADLLGELGVPGKVEQEASVSGSRSLKVPPVYRAQLEKLIRSARQLEAHLAKKVNIDAPTEVVGPATINVIDRDQGPVHTEGLVTRAEFADATSATAWFIGLQPKSGLVVADLCQLSNLLVAGTTGSGKTELLK